MTDIGRKIKERREELGMSQDELALKMGYKSRSTIAKIEKGVNDVTQSNIVRFAEILSTTPAYIMGWLDEEIEEKNDTLSDIIVRMRNDEDFLLLVEMLHKMDREKIVIFKEMLTALLK